MAVSKEDILETISNMSVMDVVELIKDMEQQGLKPDIVMLSFFSEIFWLLSSKES